MWYYTQQNALQPSSQAIALLIVASFVCPNKSWIQFDPIADDPRGSPYRAQEVQGILSTLKTKDIQSILTIQGPVRSGE